MATSTSLGIGALGRSKPGSPAADALVIVAALIVGLLVDVHTDITGQTALSAAVWMVLFYVLRSVSGEERRGLMTCLVIATSGEIALSLGWGLYTYRLGNIPMFVPPGHVLMLLLGLSLARVMPQSVAYAIFACAALYSLAAALSRFHAAAAAGTSKCSRPSSPRSATTSSRASACIASERAEMSSAEMPSSSSTDWT